MSLFPRKRIAAILLLLGAASAWAPNRHRPPTPSAQKQKEHSFLPIAEWAATGLVVASLVLNPLPTHATTEIQSDQVTVTVSSTAAANKPVETKAAAPEPPKVVAASPAVPAKVPPVVAEKKDVPKQEVKKDEPKKEAVEKKETPPTAAKVVEKPKATSPSSSSSATKAVKKEVVVKKKQVSSVKSNKSGGGAAIAGIGLAGVAGAAGIAFSSNRDTKTSRDSSSYYNSMLNTSGEDDRFMNYRPGTQGERMAEERKRAMAANAARRPSNRNSRGSYGSRTTSSSYSNDYNDDRESRFASYRAGTEQERRAEQLKEALASRRRDASTRSYRRPIRENRSGSDMSSISATDGFDRNDARFVNYRAGTQQERRAEQLKQQLADRRAASAENRGYRTNNRATDSDLGSVSGTEGFNQGDDRFVNYRAGTEQERRAEQVKQQMAARRADDAANRGYQTSRDTGSDLGSVSGTEGFNQGDDRFVNYRAGTEQERRAEQLKREMADGRADAGTNRGSDSDLSSTSGTEGFARSDARFVNYRAGTEQERKAEQMKREMATGRSDAEVRGADLYGSPGFHEFNSREPINYRAGTEGERLAEERKKAMASKGGDARAYSSPSSTDYGSPGFHEFNSREPINYRAGTEGERLAEERKRAMATKGGEARAYSSPSSTDYGTPGFNEFNSREPINYRPGTEGERMEEERKRAMGGKGLDSSGTGTGGPTNPADFGSQQQQQQGTQGSPSFPGSPQGSPSFPGSPQGTGTQGTNEGGKPW